MDNMLDRILDNIIAIKGRDKILLGMAKDKIVSFLKVSQLPERYLGYKYIDYIKNNTLNKMIENMDKNIFNNHSSLLYLDSFKYSGYIVSSIFSKFLEQKILNDSYTGNILFIDTLLLLDDYKKLINKSNDFYNIKTYYDLDILYNLVYDAEYIFWDKFNSINSDYDFSKITEIITHRFNRGKNNMYILTGSSVDKLFSNYPELLLDVLDIKYAFNVQGAGLSFIEGENEYGN